MNERIKYNDFSAVYDNEINGRSFVEYLDYYAASKKRFWNAVQRIDDIELSPGAQVIDIGGGVLAVLLSRLFGFNAMVGDVNDRAQQDVEASGLAFTLFDVFSDATPEVRDLDLVVLTEVIEHIPEPPYVVLQRLAKVLRPGGRIFLTTPNGHRFRNLVYMALGREILGIYRYPEPGMALGHQHEYTLKQMLWQAEHAGFEIEHAATYEDGFKGASASAKIGRLLATPFAMVPHLRNGITMTLRLPGTTS